MIPSMCHSLQAWHITVLAILFMLLFDRYACLQKYRLVDG